MLKRLAQRRKLVIGGCIFAAVILGLACSAPAHAALIDVSIDASADTMLSGSSEWCWQASDGDLSTTPPLGLGQEVITGGYSGTLLTSGPARISNERSLSSDSTLEFGTEQQVDSQGSGIFKEGLSVYSVGSPASGVTCGSDSLDPDGANLTRTAYCEYAGVNGQFITDCLGYHSSGSISQGDTERPDSMLMQIDATGHGSGSLSSSSRSLIGIGNTSVLGYVHAVHEEVRTDGMFRMNGRVKWTSFSGG